MSRFTPVIMGTDVGVYTLARSAHEAFGLESVVVSNQARGPISDSSIIRNAYAGQGASDEQILQTLEQVAAEHQGVPRVLLVNAEHDLEFIARHREQLAALFVLPYPDNSVLTAAADKTVLAQVCQKVGVATPRSQDVDLETTRPGQDWVAPAIDLRFPVVLKPAQSAEHLLMTFEGKRKVYTATDQAEASRVLTRLHDAGLRSRVVVQELIPGDDTQGRTVTCYISRDGRATMMTSGRLILGLHEPTMIGNSATVLTEPQPELCAQAEAVLTEMGLTGYANFDIKVDPRDGTPYFLDLNPRIGRPNYYANVAGVNPIRALAADYLGVDGPLPQHRHTGVYSILPWWLVRRYVRDRGLRKTLGRIRATERFVHPLAYSQDRSPRRWFYRQASTVNLVRDFRTHYPQLTETGL